MTKIKGFIKMSPDGIERAKSLTDEVFHRDYSSEFTEDEFLLASYRLGVPNVKAEEDAMAEYIGTMRIEQTMKELERQGTVQRVGDGWSITQKGLDYVVNDLIPRVEKKKVE